MGRVWLLGLCANVKKYWLFSLMFGFVVGHLFISQNLLTRPPTASNWNRNESINFSRADRKLDADEIITVQMKEARKTLRTATSKKPANLVALEQFFGDKNVMTIEPSHEQSSRSVGRVDDDFMARQHLEYQRRNERVRRVCQSRAVSTSPAVLKAVKSDSSGAVIDPGSSQFNSIGQHCIGIGVL